MWKAPSSRLATVIGVDLLAGRIAWQATATCQPTADSLGTAAAQGAHARRPVDVKDFLGRNDGQRLATLEEGLAHLLPDAAQRLQRRGG